MYPRWRKILYKATRKVVMPLLSFVILIDGNNLILDQSSVKMAQDTTISDQDEKRARRRHVDPNLSWFRGWLWLEKRLALFRGKVHFIVYYDSAIIAGRNHVNWKEGEHSYAETYYVDCADDQIVECTKKLTANKDSLAVAVVTSDQKLSERVSEAGANMVVPSCLFAYFLQDTPADRAITGLTELFEKG